MTLKEQIDIERLPKHIAIIMDGNGRWAKEQGKPRLFGHQSAIQSVREVNEACAELGVSYLTLYAFSIENWNRPANEVSGLMTLLSQTIKKEVSTLLKNDIRMIVTGDVNRMPPEYYNQTMEAVKKTAHCKRMTLNLAPRRLAVSPSPPRKANSTPRTSPKRSSPLTSLPPASPTRIC